MNGIKNSSLHVKILMVTFVLTLIISSAVIIVFVSNDYFQYRKVSTLFNEIMADTSDINAAVLENDQQQAGQILDGMRLNFNIADAELFSFNNNQLKPFITSHPTGAASKEESASSWFPFLEQHLQFMYPIKKHDKTIAAFLVKTKNDNYNLYGIIEIIILVIIMSFFIAMYLEDLVTKPFNSLVDAMKKVAQQNDYSVRAEKVSNDEVGILVDSFNTMLDTIQGNEKLQHESQRQIRKLAYYDALTGLPNRDLFKELLEQILVNAKRGQGQAAILYLEILTLKRIKETYGLDKSDCLLKEIIQEIKTVMADYPEFSKMNIARISSDELAIVIDDIKSLAQIETRIDKIASAINQSYVIDQQNIMVEGKIGVALCPDHGTEAEALLEHANSAMYQAEKLPNKNYVLYVQDMEKESLHRLTLENDLRMALENKEFIVFYQPKFHLPTKKISGVEALLRWQHPTRGMVCADEFIPVAEQTGLIIDIGSWVLKQACLQCQSWREIGFSEIQVAVNVSAPQFEDPNLESYVKEALAASRLMPSALELELTESIIMMSDEKTLATLNKLKKIGVKLSIDDFGTGYSSLRYLTRYPVDKVKIDKSFITYLIENPNNAIITKAIIDLAHNLSLSVVAEGVETKAQLDYLELNLCDEIQGFLLSEPFREKDLKALLSEFKRRVYG